MELKDRISTVVLANGKRIETCCARCALHYRMNHPLDEVSRILVADHESGKKIDASLAVYVEGSDVTSCRAPSEAVPREPGAAYDRMFDRCQPGLLAFRDQAAARVFASTHGGRVLDYETALASVHEH